MGISLIHSCASLIRWYSPEFSILRGRTVSQAAYRALLGPKPPIPVQSLRRGPGSRVLTTCSPSTQDSPFTWTSGCYHWVRPLTEFPRERFRLRGGTEAWSTVAGFPVQGMLQRAGWATQVFRQGFVIVPRAEEIPRAEKHIPGDFLERSEKRHKPNSNRLTLMLPARNQYTAALGLDAFIRDLLAHRSERVPDEMGGAMLCRIGKGKGFSLNAGGYTRVSFCGEKIVVHKAVLEVHAGPAPAGREDASHLCGNPACFEPTHLFWEDRASNLSRRGCAGFVLVDGVHWVKVCAHTPACKRATPGSALDDDFVPEP